MTILKGKLQFKSQKASSHIIAHVDMTAELSPFSCHLQIFSRHSCLIFHFISKFQKVVFLFIFMRYELKINFDKFSSNQTFFHKKKSTLKRQTLRQDSSYSSRVSHFQLQQITIPIPKLQVLTKHRALELQKIRLQGK